ncbi:MAG: hypothetical protein HN909_03530, partial [Phycisphaerales bacterium]|nr:hypothetical protein [Phycisphaerales bacterium]
MMKRYKTTCIAILLAGLMAGCSTEHRGSSELTFSPDGKMVAFSWNYSKTRMPASWLWPVYYNWGTKRQFLCLAPTATPEVCPQFEIHRDWGMPDFIARFAIEHVRISPDSNRVAWVDEGRLVVAPSHNPDLSAVLTPEDETIDTFCWVGRDEIVYSSLRVDEQPELADVNYKAIYRQTIDLGQARSENPPPIERRELYRAMTADDTEPFEVHLAPDKRAAILMGNLSVVLLEFDPAKAKTPIRIPRRSGKARGVCWAPNSEQVFLAFGWEDVAEGPDGAILLQRQSGKVTDFTDYFLEIFGTNPFRCNEWTVDGKFIIAMDLRMLRVYLLQLDPWVVYRFEERYDKKLPKTNGDVKSVRSLVPGWLWVRPIDEGPTYAIDYQGRRVIPIADRDWAVSPDYTQIAEVFEKGRVEVRTLDLPKLSEFSPVAAQQTQAGTTALQSHKKKWWWQNRPETPEKPAKPSVEPEAESTVRYDVVITELKSNRMVMAKTLEMSTDMEREEAMEKLKSLPVAVGEGMTKAEAELLLRTLESAGGKG